MDNLELNEEFFKNRKLKSFIRVGQTFVDIKQTIGFSFINDPDGYIIIQFVYDSGRGLNAFLRDRNDFSQYITDMYISLKEISTFVKQDCEQNGFKIKYLKKSNALQPIKIEKEDDKEVERNYYTGSMARHIVIQLCGYAAFLSKLIKANKEVNWYPDYVGEKRFGNWLENVQDWGISRSRYWGCPIPLWTCECGHKEMIGSIDELVEKATEKIDRTIDLHKPYVDNVHIKCPDCGKEMTRIPDVVDVWFDSGAVPFAQYHYPFENKEYFESHFPADFIAEGLDQTRGWFLFHD